MIYVADISSVGVQHEQFNTSFLQLVVGKNHPVRFYGDHTHTTILKRRAIDVSFTDIHVYSKRGGLKEFIRAYHQFKSLRHLVKDASSEKVNQVIVLLIHPFAHFLFKQFVITNVEIFIVMHGELESVKFNKHFLNKIWGWFLKKALEKVRRNVGYIILGQSIYNNLVKVLPNFASQKSLVLDHPYPFDSPSHRRNSSGQIVFSSLGVATLSKNSQYLFEVAQNVKDSGFNATSSFNICGRVYKNMQAYLNDYVNFKKGFESLTREELNSLLAETDFAVFYYDNTHYSLCSSGAFWDAIDAEIPLLYVRNDYFDYYASIVGELGMAFESPKELNQYILETVKSGVLDPNYFHFVENIKKLKYEYMSLENLSKQLHLNLTNVVS
jgi:hypothetical protein